MSLFACSRCYSRHPFEELSSGQQLCKACRTTSPYVKCTYCRTEFQQTSSKSPSSVCKKCECNVKSYGKPASCVYCNIFAAFIGSKCQRCTNSEKKYGLPVACEQCKMACAFDRKSDDKKVDGKLLCWLCTLSYKRALAKAPTHSTSHHSHSHHHHSLKHSLKRLKNDKRPLRPDVTKLEEGRKVSGVVTVEKKEQKLDLDNHNCSDHVGAVNQLREQIAGLNRTVVQRDRELLSKERMITDLKASNFTTETELRNKLKEAQRDYEQKVSGMTIKLKQLQKELAMATKGKANKKSSLTIVSSKRSEEDSD